MDPPVRLSLEEIRQRADLLWTAWIRRRDGYPSRSQASSGPAINQAMMCCFDDDKVQILVTKRNPSELEEALQKGRKLEEVRAMIEDQSGPTRLPSGAHIFVHPNLYVATKNAVARMHLRPYHIIVSESFKWLVMEVINELPSRTNVKVTSEEDIAYVSAGQFHVVKNTFIDEAPVQRRPDSVANSTSKIHKAPSPRLALQNMVGPSSE